MRALPSGAMMLLLVACEPFRGDAPDDVDAGTNEAGATPAREAGTAPVEAGTADAGMPDGGAPPQVCNAAFCSDFDGAAPSPFGWDQAYGAAPLATTTDGTNGTRALRLFDPDGATAPAFLGRTFEAKTITRLALSFRFLAHQLASSGNDVVIAKLMCPDANNEVQLKLKSAQFQQLQVQARSTGEQAGIAVDTWVDVAVVWSFAKKTANVLVSGAPSPDVDVESKNVTCSTQAGVQLGFVAFGTTRGAPWDVTIDDVRIEMQ